MKAKIYHNPRCSKSRATLQLLAEHAVATEIVPYLESPPDADELRLLLKLLDTRAAAIIRTGEAPFRESGLTLDAPEDALLDLLTREPIVMQRPIVVVGDRACIGRPPENVLELIT